MHAYAWCSLLSVERIRAGFSVATACSSVDPSQIGQLCGVLLEHVPIRDCSHSDMIANATFVPSSPMYV